LLKFSSADYLSSLRQILSTQPQKSSQNTSPYRFMFKVKVKFINLSRRDLHLDGAKFGLVKFSALLALIKFAVKFSKIGKNYSRQNRRSLNKFFLPAKERTGRP